MRSPRADRRSVGRLGLVLAVVLIVDLAIAAYLVYRSQARPVPRTEVERRLLAAQEALKSGRGDDDDWAAYALALADAGSMREALRAVDEGLSAYEDSPALLLAYGRILARQGRDDDAIAAFRRLEAAVQDRRADALAKTGAESKAYAAELTEASIEAARLELQARSWEEAIRWLDIALKESPGMADALVKRAEAYAALGDADAARRDAEAALRFVPGFAPALDLLRSLEATR
ncbi:MAG: tetratricopeptide repeat protein [Coriobacteriia bacterium]|nr:tetratricopeptide repeat protein [Coriobacteriia bacterium]